MAMVSQTGLFQTRRSQTLETLNRVEQWLEKGHGIWLATVMQTWPDSPRPAGTLLAIDDKRQPVGCDGVDTLENALLEQTVRDHEGERPIQVHHRMTPADCDRFRLPGGDVTLLVEPLRGQTSLSHIQAIRTRLEERQKVTRSVGHVGMQILESRSLAPGILVDHHHVLHTLVPDFRLLVIGAGEPGRHLADMAVDAGFQVSVCDPREAFRRDWPVSRSELVSSVPEDIIPERFSDPYCAILALADQPDIEDDALFQALAGDAFFIGALGDVRVCAERRRRLHDRGLESASLARLHAPLGFEIGSRTPAEKAVAVMAQLISERYRAFLRPDQR